jgi:S1-C subfamily serine protease
VTLTVLHGDDQRTLNATLDDRNGRAYLGVSSCGAIGGDVLKWATELEAQRGATILEVQADSPAQDAGLAAGDRIVAVDGEEVNEASSLADLIAAHQPGDSVTLTVENADQESREVEVTLGEHPDKEGVAYLGVQYSNSPRVFRFGGDAVPFGDVMPFFRDQLPFEIPFGDFGNLDKSGVIVGEVNADSPASAAGLQAGDLITAVDGKELTAPNSLRDAISAHQPGDSVTLTVSRAGESEELQIEATLGESPDAEGQAYLGVTVGGFISTHRFGGWRRPTRSWRIRRSWRT